MIEAELAEDLSSTHVARGLNSSAFAERKWTERCILSGLPPSESAALFASRSGANQDGSLTFQVTQAASLSYVRCQLLPDAPAIVRAAFIPLLRAAWTVPLAPRESVASPAKKIVESTGKARIRAAFNPPVFG